MKKQYTMSHGLRRLLVIGVLLSGVSACGGGGSSSSAPPPVNTASSSWDQLIWDQDNWG